jgi:hypothetical protein
MKGMVCTMKITKAAAVVLSGGVLFASLPAVNVFAEDGDKSVEMYAVYNDYTDHDVDYWEIDDEISPSVVADCDGEYTVELNIPDGKTAQNLGYIGVRLIGGDEIDDLDVSLVSLTIDGEDYPVKDGEYDGKIDFSVIHNTEGAEYPEFKGATKFTVTLKLEGLGEAASSVSSDSSAPTLGFDADDWSKYISVFDETESNSLSLNSERDVVYQGASVKLTANLSSAPDYSKEDAPAMGIELKAADFGLKNFDGYTLNFFARFNVNIEDLLYNNSIFIYGMDDEDNMTTSTIKTITYSATSNVNNYEKQFTTFASGSNTTRIIIKVPITEAYSGDVLYLDNLTLMTDEGNLATVDTYNSGAEIVDKGDVIKQQKKGVTVDNEKIEKDSDKVSVVTIVIIVAAVVLVGGTVTILVIKQKKRFY